MKLEEVIERLKDDVKYADLRDIVDDDCTICFIEDIETVLQHIEHLEKENEELKNIDLTTVYIKGVCDEKERWRNKIREKIDNQIKKIEKLLDEMTDKSIGAINVSYLNKKEREEVINKRNCLLVQKATLIQVKEYLLKEE